MYDKTITLFNRVRSNSGDTWKFTVLEGVDLIVDKAAILAKYGESSQDNARLHVRYTGSKDAPVIGGKVWMSPKAWRAQTSIGDTLTFTAGKDFDFFWEGVWTGSGDIADSGYTDGFYNYMLQTYDNVFAITSVGGPYTVIPHFEITGK